MTEYKKTTSFSTYSAFESDIWIVLNLPESLVKANACVWLAILVLPLVIAVNVFWSQEGTATDKQER